jgi:ABC-type uncharacterized transport system fused permease/ATPase subunit
LDEATSALDLQTEAAMYTLLDDLYTHSPSSIAIGPGANKEAVPEMKKGSAKKVTVISVGHRPSLLRYHTSKLVFRGVGLEPVAVQIDGIGGGGGGGSGSEVVAEEWQAVEEKELTSLDRA